MQIFFNKLMLKKIKGKNLIDFVLRKQRPTIAAGIKKSDQLRSLFFQNMFFPKN